MTIRRKIAAVSYLNTVPFIYGIGHAELLHADLLLSPPSRCTEAFNAGDADIALLPVGSLPYIENAEIVTPYCIGASAPVRTVTVMCDRPVEETRRLWLDGHSRSSALLVRILCAEQWHIAPEWRQLDDYSAVDTRQEGDAFLLIGDKVFDYEGRFRHTYDLADCWRTLTGLPFVFAVWVARRGVEPETVDALGRSLRYGVEHVREAIDYYGHSGKPYAYDYLTKNIDFLFDGQKQKALSLYWEKGLKVDPRVNPG